MEKLFTYLWIIEIMNDARSPRVVHLSSSHPSDDTRIFVKFCGTHSSSYRTYFICFDNSVSRTVSGVEIICVGGRRTRLSRVFFGSVSILFASFRFFGPNTIYQIHDPELIPLAFLLSILGQNVIFDSHEDYIAVLYSREYIPRKLSHFCQPLLSFLLSFFLRPVSLVYAATPSIQESLSLINIKSQVIYNYPVIYNHDFQSNSEAIGVCSSCFNLVYVGAVSYLRGIAPVINALESLDDTFKLHIIGDSFEQDSYKFIVNSPSSHRIILHGHLPQSLSRQLISRCDLGIVTFLDCPNHIEALPNKMFEYMAEGVPVLASDFPLWRKYVTSINAGITVDPTSAFAISSSIRYLSNKTELLQTMSKNAQAAILNSYSWQSQESTILGHCNDLLNN